MRRFFSTLSFLGSLLVRPASGISAEEESEEISLLVNPRSALGTSGERQSSLFHLSLILPVPHILRLPFSPHESCLGRASRKSPRLGHMLRSFILGLVNSCIVFLAADADACFLSVSFAFLFLLVAPWTRKILTGWVIPLVLSFQTSITSIQE